MKFELEAGVGAHPVKLGMKSDELRAFLKAIPKILKEGPDQGQPGEDYDRLGVTLFYRPDGSLEAAVFNRKSLVIWQGRDCFKLGFAELARALEELDPELEYDTAGCTSFKLGIGFFAPDCEENPDGPIDSVISFAEGYYLQDEEID